jgi:hypothetical protein
MSKLEMDFPCLLLAFYISIHTVAGGCRRSTTLRNFSSVHSFPISIECFSGNYIFPLKVLTHTSAQHSVAWHKQAAACQTHAYFHMFYMSRVAKTIFFFTGYKESRKSLVLNYLGFVPAEHSIIYILSRPASCWCLKRRIGDS